jgi:hypothetical protein
MPPILLSLGLLTEASADVYLTWEADAGVRDVDATLRGPQSDYARTLPGDFSFVRQGTETLKATVADPCYWTPELPLLYDLRVKWRNQRGDLLEASDVIGLRRWESRGQSFFLNRRRTVLRGVKLSTCDSAVLHNAREVEAALWLPTPSRDTCVAAEQIGVAVVADLRSAANSLDACLSELAWRSSIMLAVIDVDQIRAIDSAAMPEHLQVAVYIGADTSEADWEEWRRLNLLPWIRCLAAETAGGRGLPDWLADWKQTIVAITSDETYFEISQGRAACDRLQTALAPQWDLSGYFTCVK